MKHSNPELRLKYLTNMCVNTVAELSTVECPGVTGDMGTEYTVVLVAERSAVFLSGGLTHGADPLLQGF